MEVVEVMEDGERHVGEVEVWSIGRGRVWEVNEFEGEIEFTYCDDRDRGLDPAKRIRFQAGILR